jgi:hypothetical protein
VLPEVYNTYKDDDDGAEHGGSMVERLLGPLIVFSRIRDSTTVLTVTW